MAYDKVVDSAVLDENLTAVADAIRAVAGTEESLAFPEGFVEAIAGLSGGGGVVETASVSDLELFDIVKFGRYNGSDLYWFVSDTGYNGHIIMTIVPSTFALNGALYMNESCLSSSGANMHYDGSRYRTSSLRQFLNSTSEAWYESQWETQNEPDYASYPGFLSGFSSEELSKIIPFELNCVEYTSTSAYTIESVTDEVWIPSKKQCGGNAGTAEGTNAFAATSLSSTKALVILSGSTIFKYTRTQTSAAGYVATYDNMITYAFSGLYPICISIDPNATVQYTTDKAGGVCCWEVVE